MLLLLLPEKGVFHNLKYPKSLVETTIKLSVERRVSYQGPSPSPDVPSDTVRSSVTLKSKETYGQTRGLSNLEMKHIGKLAIIGALLKAKQA